MTLESWDERPSRSDEEGGEPGGEEGGEPGDDGGVLTGEPLGVTRVAGPGAPVLSGSVAGGRAPTWSFRQRECLTTTSPFCKRTRYMLLSPPTPASTTSPSWSNVIVNLVRRVFELRSKSREMSTAFPTKKRRAWIVFERSMPYTYAVVFPLTCAVGSRGCETTVSLAWRTLPRISAMR